MLHVEQLVKPTLQIVGRDAVTSLPVLATAADVREVIRFLKRHPEGITAIQAMDAFRKRIFDARKVSAYEFWGIVVRSGDRLKLSPLGWDLTNRLSPEVEIYRTVLNNTEPYHAGLEWIQQRNLELVTHLDIGNFWRTHYAHVLERDTEEQLQAYAASFFHICHAAEVGTVTMGRKGQPTRLHIYPQELRSYFDKAEASDIKTGQLFSNASTKAEEQIPLLRTSTRLPRVLISHHQKPDLIKHITDAVELADFQYEILDRTTGMDQSLIALQRCEAGVLVIADEYCDANGRISDVTLIQIGAALMQFEKRLLLVVKRGLVLPETLRSLPCYEIEGEVTWGVVVQLVKSLKQFRV